MIEKCWLRPGDVHQSLDAEGVWSYPRTTRDRENCRVQNNPHNGGICVPDYGSAYCGSYNRCSMPGEQIAYSNRVSHEKFYGNQCGMINNSQIPFVPQCHMNNVPVLNQAIHMPRGRVAHHRRMVAPQTPVIQQSGYSNMGQISVAPVHNHLVVQPPMHGVAYGVPEQYMRVSETGYRYKRSNMPQLPCNSSENAKSWNYNSMCFDINNDGSNQPCSYTNVVDLEDFMNNEKRKEKSRDAARCRRHRETKFFEELGDALPMRNEEVEQLDKATVMRLAIAYLRVRDVVKMLPQLSMKPANGKVKEQMLEVPDVCFLQALDGFVFAISIQGDIVFVSENIADYLGVTQTEMMGQSVFEFSHPCDHEELRELLRPARHAPGRHPGHTPHAFLLRLKCTLTTKGRNLNLKSASYKVIHCTGHVLSAPEDAKSKSSIGENTNAEIKSDDTEKLSGKTTPLTSNRASLVAVGRLIPHPSNIEVPLDCKTFLSKHSLDMKFTYADDSMLGALGYRAEELSGVSAYQCHYSMDSAALAQHFKCLFSKGQCETGRYRFLARSGGYAWVLTQATLIQDKQQRPVSVVCVNYVISGVERKDEVFSESQLHFAAEAAVKSESPASLPEVTAASPKLSAVAPEVTVPAPRAVDLSSLLEKVAPELREEILPIPATANIFAPRTKEMNKGFLMFSEDDPSLTMLKEEPEDLTDLTHLAPTPGDACIPLDDNPFDVFEEYMLSDGYCGLLNDELGSPSTPRSLLLSEPDLQESDSSCEQSLLTELALEGAGGHGDTGRESNPLSPTPLSSYISMSGSDDPMLLSHEPPELVMWGALPDHVSMHRELRRPSVPCAALSPPACAPHASHPPHTPHMPHALQRLLASQPEGAETGVEPALLLEQIYSGQGNLLAWRGGGDESVDRACSKRGVDTGTADSESSKRTRRSSPPPSPTPAPTLAPTSTPAPASSVLMNLLDNPPVPLGPPDKLEINTGPPPHHAFPPSRWKDKKMAIDDLSLMTQHTRKYPNITSPINSYLMSPLSLNLGSPMSPNYLASITPRLSPAVSERYDCYPSPPTAANSPLAGYNHIFYKNKTDLNLLSPLTILQTANDPLLTNSVRGQISPIVDGSLYKMENNIRVNDKGLNSAVNSPSVQNSALQNLGLSNVCINNQNVNESTNPDSKLFDQMIADTGVGDMSSWMTGIC